MTPSTPFMALAMVGGIGLLVKGVRRLHVWWHTPPDPERLTWEEWLTPPPVTNSWDAFTRDLDRLIIGLGCAMLAVLVLAVVGLGIAVWISGGGAQ